MKGFILGAIAGAAAAIVCAKKMKKEDYEKFCDKTNEMWDKAEQKMKDGVDTGKNKAEYYTDRAEDYLETNKDMM